MDIFSLPLEYVFPHLAKAVPKSVPFAQYIAPAAGFGAGYYWRKQRAKYSSQETKQQFYLLRHKDMNYSQRDPRWSNLKLGASGLDMGNWGCYVSSIAQLLTLAGYNVTPGDVCTTLNNNKGFTEDGLAIWAKVMQAYPQFKYGGAGYKIVQGRFSNGLYHYMAVETTSGTLFDPWTGKNTASAALTGYFQNIGITKAPVVVRVEVPQETPQWPRVVTISNNATPWLNNRPEPNSNRPTSEARVSTDGKRYERLLPGWEITVVGVVDGEDVNGNNKWYKSTIGNYFSAYYTNQPNI